MPRIVDVAALSFKVLMSPVNLDRIQDWVNQGRLDSSKPITMRELNKSRCIHGVKHGVKVLARVGWLPTASSKLAQVAAMAKREARELV